ncbi:MAG: rhodanese-like domain-containing protein, partial [Chitinophagales bacterium]
MIRHKPKEFGWKIKLQTLFRGKDPDNELFITVPLYRKLYITMNNFKISLIDSKHLIEASTQLKIIDVRTAEEYEQQHIPGSENIPVDSIRDTGIPYQQNTPVLIACNLGLKKSEDAAQSLKERGYT